MQKFSNASVIDLQKKETARASMRKMVKHLLKKYKYAPTSSGVRAATKRLCRRTGWKIWSSGRP